MNGIARTEEKKKMAGGEGRIRICIDASGSDFKTMGVVLKKITQWTRQLGRIGSNGEDEPSPVRIKGIFR